MPSSKPSRGACKTPARPIDVPAGVCRSLQRPWHVMWSPRPMPMARKLMAIALLVHPPVSHALQLVEASDGLAAEAVLSIKEPTRLRIEGAHITDVVGNIYSSQCGPAAPGAGIGPLASPPSASASALGPVNPAGDVTIACDRDKGEVYLRPVGEGTRPINLFVSSEIATYTLLLRRADTPADTIVIRDRTPRDLRAVDPMPSPAGPAPSHVRTMKALLVAMASDRIPPDIRVEEAKRAMQLWADTRLTLLRRYEGRGFVGERYVLHNVGASTIALKEQAFDRPSSPSDGDIAGIAIEHHNLGPGEVTSLYVLRRGGTR